MTEGHSVRAVRSTSSRRAAIGVAVVVALVLAATAAIAAIAALPGSDPGSHSTPSRASAISHLGFYPGYANLAQLKSLETWVGHDASYVVQFADQDATKFDPSVWGEVAKAGALQTLAGRVTLVESIPLAFGPNIDATTAAGRSSARANLQETVAGTYDSQYRRAAEYLKTGGFADAVIRLGWEFDGDWYPWSAHGNEALWISAYRHVADVLRSVSPGFRFDWDGDAGLLQQETAAYPGDTYVDIVGLDVYDKGLPVAWDPTTASWSDPEGAFQWELSNLRFQRDFAVSHHKQVSYPEWGLAGVNATATSKVGGDDPTFVRGMSTWMGSLAAKGPGSLAYQAYFDEDAADGRHRIDTGSFPAAKRAFLSLFGPSLVGLAHA
jgi:hypothetical protein